MSANVTSTIIMSGVVASGLTIINKVSQKQSVEPRVIIGGFVVSLLLLGVAEVYPEPARLLAILIVVTSILINGSVVFGAIDRLVNG